MQKKPGRAGVISRDGSLPLSKGGKKKLSDFEIRGAK
jgi:hypothetical protein